MKDFSEMKRIVIKIGSSSLTHSGGGINFRKIDRLAMVLSDIKNMGKEVILVTSGAVSAGMSKLGMVERPKEMAEKQAAASVGQCELMFIYDKFFGEYSRTVAQVLLTGDVVDHERSRKNVENTFAELIGMGIIPIVNENDTVGVDELVGSHIGDNDTLSAIVAQLTQADLLILLTDIDGLYTANPRIDPDARRIPYVAGVTEEVEALAGGAGTNRGTGGMATKVRAAKMVNAHGIPCCVMSGANPESLYRLFDGEQLGTVFGMKRREKM